MCAHGPEGREVGEGKLNRLARSRALTVEAVVDAGSLRRG